MRLVQHLMTEASHSAYMNLFESRYSCRKFDPSRMVPRSILERIIEVGSLAPSAKNSQPWSVYVSARDDLAKRVSRIMRGSIADVKRRIGDAESNSIAVSAQAVEDASYMLYICLSKTRSQTYQARETGVPTLQSVCSVDLLGIGAFAENILLAAASMEIASLWICDVLYERVQIEEAIGSDTLLIGAIALGYPIESTISRKVRLPIQGFIHYCSM